MGNRLPSCLPSAPHFPPHHTLLPSSYLPLFPVFISLPIYISSPLSLSLSLTHTHTHTQNEQINYVAMLEREEITAARDDERLVMKRQAAANNNNCSPNKS